MSGVAGSVGLSRQNAELMGASWATDDCALDVTRLGKVSELGVNPDGATLDERLHVTGTCAPLLPGSIALDATEPVQIHDLDMIVGFVVVTVPE
jgi:hypothetical protein